MHELSVAQRLVELVAEEIGGQGVARVTAVHLRLGPLSSVVADALLFAFDAATSGTLLEGAKLQIEEVEPAVFCPKCKKERPLPSVQRLRCPVCHTPTPQVVRGRELEVTAVEVVDATEREAANRTGAATSAEKE